MFVLAGIAGDLQGLTLLILGVLAFIVLAMYRKPITAVIYRLTGLKLQHGDWVAEAQMGEQEATEDLPPPTAEEAQDEEEEDEGPRLLAAGKPADSAEDAAAEATDDGLDSESDTDALERQMIDAVFAKNEERGRRAYERLQELVSDPVERKVIKARWLAIRDYAGLESGVVEKLTVLAEDDAAAPAVLYLKGVVLAHAGQPRAAADAFRESSEREKDAAVAARAAGEEAKSLQKAGEVVRAVERLEELIRSAKDDGARSTLWLALAEIHERQGEHELRALALQQALERNPSDTKLRFRIAYSYSESGTESFAPAILHHYSRLLSFNPDDSVAWNNSGVQFESLDLPITSVRHYRKAVERDNTLASSNLAYRLSHAGFADEAEEFLKEAAAKPSPHENVAGATAALSSARSREDERRAELADVGQQQAEFLSGLGKAGILRGPEGFTGTWRMENGQEVPLSLKEGSVTGEWERSKVKHKLTASVHGASARGAFHEMRYWTYSGERRETGWERKDVAYMYLAEEGDLLALMRMKGKSVQFERMTRVG